MHQPWICQKLHRHKSWLHPGPHCSPSVTPSLNTADRLSRETLTWFPAASMFGSPLNGIIICSEQTASLVLTLTFPDKSRAASPSLFAAVTHSTVMRLLLPLRQNASPHFRPAPAPPNGLFPSLRSVQTPSEPTLTSLEDRAMNSRAWLVDTKPSRALIGWKWVRPGNSWGGAAFKWKEGKGGAGWRRKVGRCPACCHQSCHRARPPNYVTTGSGASNHPRI